MLELSFSSKSEEVSELDEELPAIVDEPVATTNNLGTRVGRHYVDVLSVRVEADMKGGPGVNQVRQQKVGIEVLFDFLVGKILIRQERVILHNYSQREFTIKLIVPLRAYDVVREHIRTGVAIHEPSK